MKFKIVLAALLVSSVSLADSFKVEWTLTTDKPVSLDKESFAFKATKAECSVSKAVKEYAPDLGLGLTESRILSCKSGKKVIQQSVYCTRKEISNTAEIILNKEKIQLSCNTL
jgi:hypothetical protein